MVLSTSCRILRSRSQLSKTRLVKCGKKYGTILLRQTLSISNERAVKTIAIVIHRITGYCKISIERIERYRLFICTSLLNRSLPSHWQYQQTASRNKRANIRKPRAAIRRGISENRVFFENRETAINIR